MITHPNISAKSSSCKAEKATKISGAPAMKIQQKRWSKNYAIQTYKEVHILYYSTTHTHTYYYRHSI